MAMTKTGLVLSGGGARGAYQAGVLAAIAEIAAKLNSENPFPIFSGVSAGALNASILAASATGFSEACDNLIQLWSQISTDTVYYADLMNISRSGWDWMTELTPLSSKEPNKETRSLFSTTPLRSLLTESCRFENIQRKIDRGLLHGISVSAIEYDSMSSKTFFQGARDIKTWERPMHRGEKCTLSIEHIMASAAIPILFPAIKVGNRYYGDGCIRNQSPCSPAIYMGAEQIIAIGVRRKTDTWYTYHHPEPGAPPNMTRLINVIFHSIMMDGLELDIQRINQTNEQVALLTAEQRRQLKVHEVKALWIHPSRDISKIAQQRRRDMPRLIRYVLPGNFRESSELLSFLLFEKKFCEELIEIGFNDGMKSRDEIERLLTPQSRLQPSLVS